MEYQISEQDLGPQLALVHRTPVTMETIADGIGGAFRVLVEHAGQTGAQWAGPPFVLYPEVCEGEFDIAVCMPVVPGAEAGDQVSLEEVPGGPVAETVHVGPYGGVGQAYVALQKWMTDNGRTPLGPVRETYLNDPESVAPEELLTQVDWPVG